jgi:Protein of unknown function DUF262
MTTPSFFGEPRLPRLSRLLHEIKNGEIHVPRFQRPFVWSPEQRLSLLQSIYLGYPIGSILVWRTQTWAERLTIYDRLGPVRLPKIDAQAGIVRQFLLDGHQRMTTLFASLGPGLYDKSELVDAWRESGAEDPQWPIYFDLLDADDQPFRLPSRLLSRDPMPETWLPLNILMDSYALSEFKDQLRAKEHSRETVNRVQSIADIFGDYAIPVVPIATEDLVRVTTSFKRVNSGGSKMSEVHMVNALTWSADFDLLEHMDDIDSSLAQVGWAGFDPQMVLNVCKAEFGLDIYRATPEALAGFFKKNPKALDGALEALEHAASILRTIAGVHGPAILPYSYQAVLLADALRGHQTLSESAMIKLNEWFWLTTLTEFFRGMTGSLFRRAQAHLGELLLDKADPRPPDMQDEIDPLRRFDFKSARSRAIALLLAELKPKSPMGEPLEASDLLALHGNDALVRLIPSSALPNNQRKLAQGPENRFLLSPRQGAELRKRLETEAETSLKNLLHSHAVTSSALSALKQHDYERFLKERRERLWSMEKERAESVGLTYRLPVVDT